MAATELASNQPGKPALALRRLALAWGLQEALDIGCRSRRARPLMAARPRRVAHRQQGPHRVLPSDRPTADGG